MEYLERMERMETMKERMKEKTKERTKMRKPCIRKHGNAFYFHEYTHKTYIHTHARNPLQGPSLLTYTFFCMLGSSRTRGGPSI